MMNNKKMSEKFDRTSAKDAHWRIDEVLDVLGGITEVVENHSSDINAFKKGISTLRVAAYTVAGTILTAELGILSVLRKYLGI